MKKFYALLLNILMLCLLFIFSNSQSVFAQEFENNLVIDQDIEIDETGLEYNFANLQSGCAIVISAGTNVTFRNLKINIGEGQNISNVILIEQNAKLILDNVEITLLSKPQNAIIENNGIVEINNCNFPNISAKDTFVDIVNNSDEIGAVTLHNIAENDLTRIKISQGSIYVDENTSIAGVINLCMDEDYAYISECEDKYVGRALVKGINTFAGKYIDNFQFDGAPKETDIDDASDYIFESFKDKYYLDYVGYLGDDLSVCNDGYIVNYNDEYVDTIDSGDIILTKFSIKFKTTSDVDSSYVKFIDETQTPSCVYVGGRYATANMFLKYLKAYELNNFYVSGNVIKKTTDVGIVSSYKFVLDNVTAIMGNTTSYLITLRGKIPFQTMHIKTFLYELNDSYNDSDALETKSLSVCPSVLISGEEDILYTSHILTYINLNDYEFESIICEDLSVTRIVSTTSLEILDIEIGQNFNANDLKVILNSVAPKVTNVSLQMDYFSADYNGCDQVAKFTPYYVIGDEKNYLKRSEFSIFKIDEECETETDKIIDAGNYKIVAGESEDGYVFENIEFDISISKIGLSIVYSNTNCVYDGSQKFVEHTIIGLIDGESVEIDFDNNGQILPGNYAITAEIVSSKNYYILDSCKSCNLFIDKATIDMSKAIVENKEVEYTGEYFSLGLKNEVAGLKCNSLKYSDVGTYNIEITFEVIDLTLYYPLQDSERKIYRELKITPKIIDLSFVEFEDIEHFYDGTAVKLEISQDIYDLLPEAVSTDIKIVGDNVINASDNPYEVSITFKLREMYLKNYVLSTSLSTTSTFTCNIYIKKAIIDESEFKVENLTIDYDGVSHQIVPENLPKDLVDYENLDGERVDCGEYTQTIKLALRDSQNYEPLSKDEYSAVLIIKPATFDMSAVKFENKTVTFEPSVYYSLQASEFDAKLSVSYKYYLDDTYLEDVGTKGVCVCGEYKVVASFQPMGDWKNNSNPISDMTAILIINKKEIDLSLFTFKNKTIVYDGLQHSLEVTGAENISFEYSQTNLINAGRYEIIATPIFDTDNYKLKNEQELKATLIIQKGTIDLSFVEFENISKIYDKQTVVAKIKGELPSGVNVRYTNNEQIFAGEYTAVASFDVEGDNFEPIPDKTCTIKIERKPVSVVLNQSTFVYTGEPINVSAYAVGVIEGDNVIVTIKNNGNINVNNYSSEILLSDTNYCCTQTLVSYVIEKADLDLSKLTFNDVEVVYDGKEHTPKLEGALPIGVTANIVGKKVINVGEYLTYVDFLVTNPNYKTPDRLVAKSKVLPKSLLLEFSDYTNIVEDGERHDVSVSFVGLVEDNFDDYKMIYSAEPIVAGQYTVRVELNENSNYIILGNNALTFEILTSTKTYINKDFELLVKSDGFSTNSNIVLVQNNENIEAKLIDFGVSPKEYSAFKLEMNNVENRKEVMISIKPNAIDTTNSKCIKVYKLSNNTLTEIDFELSNNKINFVANIGDEIVVVEEKDELEKNKVAITTIIVLALLAMSFVVYVVFKKKSKKSQVKYFIDIDME